MKPNPLRELSDRFQGHAINLVAPQDRSACMVRAGDLAGLALTVDAWAEDVRADGAAAERAAVVAALRHSASVYRASEHVQIARALASTADAVEAGRHIEEPTR